LVLVIASDTSDSRGSLAVREDGRNASVLLHENSEDYSSWLLPAVAALSEGSGQLPQNADVFAVCTGPGSFTGLRVGLTTAKAWSEVYGKPIVGISRLEAMASRVAAAGYIASCYDAQRGHVFGALFQNENGTLTPVDSELVVSPEQFLEVVQSRCGAAPVHWISLDPDQITQSPQWKDRERAGDSMFPCRPDLARSIAELAEQRARLNQFTDTLLLDANYVRRSDAEIFWKDR
jgi:tRNA threonylcarbamoyladenosine biosynthesis protein TsaB